MCPVLPQLPPNPLPESQIVWIEPPSASTLRSRPPWKKAIERLSGDQNGLFGIRVPSRRRASRDSRERTHNQVLPWGSSPTNANRRPSGESTGAPSLEPDWG